MRLSSNDVMSRPTLTAARSLVTVGGAALAVEYYNLKPVKFPFFYDDVPIEAYRIIVLIALVFLLFSLSINWKGDYDSYERWFESHAIAKIDKFSESRLNSTENPIDAIIFRIGELITSLENLEKKSPEHLASSSNVKVIMDGFKSNLDPLVQLMNELQPRLKNLKSWAWITICGWHFIVPMSIGLGAIISVSRSMF